MLTAQVRLVNSPRRDAHGRITLVHGLPETVTLIAAHSGADAGPEGPEWVDRDTVTIYADGPLGGDRALWEIPGFGGQLTQLGDGDSWAPPWATSLPLWRGKLERGQHADRATR